MRKRSSLAWMLVLLVMLVSLLAPSAQAQTTTGQPPAPVKFQPAGQVSTMGFDAPGGNPGAWYLGATPPNVDNTKPVLVFVHGKGGWSGIWWQDTVYHGTNDMYTYAYNNGYRTAFVDLYPEGSMWDNGALLNQLLGQITAHFGVAKVTIIAHSKGGVDSNSASVHYGANPKISKVITLGTPHRGTPLADMAFSTWTWWLAELLGQTTDATYVMQTGYMNYFRSITDGRDPVPYYTFSGYKCGPFLSALWWGCATIGGEDDGVVPVGSARIPGGTHLKEGYWDHDEIRMGSRVWSYFAPYIRTASQSSVAAEGALLAAAPSRARTDAAPVVKPSQAPGNVILRGGNTAGVSAPAFPVESGVKGVDFNIYASSPDFVATLTAPDGKTYTVAMTEQVTTQNIYAGSWRGGIRIPSPPAGPWSISGWNPPGKAGFLMVAALDSDLQAMLDAGSDISVPGGKRALGVAFGGSRVIKSSKAEASLKAAGQQAASKAVLPAAAGKHQAQVDVPAATGIHNVTVDVTGTLSDGSAFERTLVSSFAAVPVKDRGSWKK